MAKQAEIILLTGFLGAGKTTLLNRLLKSPCLTDTGFIINEFGAVGIDNQLVETADESMVELMNGCLCCTIKGDLPDTVASLLEKSRQQSSPLRHIVIETTGLADPAPIMQVLMGTPFLQGAVRLSTVLAVADAVEGAGNLRRFAEARRQVMFADRIIISKADLAGASAAEHLRAELRELNGAAEILLPPLAEGRGAEAEREKEFCRACLAAPIAAAGNHAQAAAAEHGEHHYHQGHGSEIHEHESHEHGEHEEHGHHHDISRHGDTICSFTLTAREPLPLCEAEQFAYLLSQKYGRKILRFKGFIRTDRAGKTYLFQGVQGQFYQPQLFSRGKTAITDGANTDEVSCGAMPKSRGISDEPVQKGQAALKQKCEENAVPEQRHIAVTSDDTDKNMLSGDVTRQSKNEAEGVSKQSQIVIIADGVNEAEIRRLFDACRNAPAPDTADRAALTDNPLAIPGMKF